jgi:xanthine dehydrogenase accessory factor
VRRAVLEELLAARDARKPVALVTYLQSSKEILVYGDTGVQSAGVEPALRERVQQAFDQDRSDVVETPAGSVFIDVFLPPRRMFIVGAVHIAQALAPMAMLAGYEVFVIDPRRAFASSARFPAVNIVTEWPDRALRRLQPDRRTAIITLTHDAKLDEPALQSALQSEAFYIGALGSRKTQALRRERLVKSGFGEQQLARIHGPAGLALGARTPGEIAVSIMAEVTQVSHRDMSS